MHGLFQASGIVRSHLHFLEDTCVPACLQIEVDSKSCAHWLSSLFAPVVVTALLLVAVGLVVGFLCGWTFAKLDGWLRQASRNPTDVPELEGVNASKRSRLSLYGAGPEPITRPVPIKHQGAVVRGAGKRAASCDIGADW